MRKFSQGPVREVNRESLRYDQAMPDYRAFKLTREGHVILVDELRCEEEDAKAHARELATDTPVELWQGPRRIARFEPGRDS